MLLATSDEWMATDEVYDSVPLIDDPLKFLSFASTEDKTNEHALYFLHLHSCFLCFEQELVEVKEFSTERPTFA